jgi:hypothetical protein
MKNIGKEWKVIKTYLIKREKAGNNWKVSKR